MMFEVDVDDFDEDFFVDGNDLFGQFDVFVGEFGDVDQVFDVVCDVYECIEWNEFGDFIWCDLIDCVGVGEDLLWVFLCCFQ